jgi:hypothetical protein
MLDLKYGCKTTRAINDPDVEKPLHLEAKVRQA